MTYEVGKLWIFLVSPLEGIILQGYLENNAFVFIDLSRKWAFSVHTQY
jgi:hypothetical protein